MFEPKAATSSGGQPRVIPCLMSPIRRRGLNGRPSSPTPRSAPGRLVVPSDLALVRLVRLVAEAPQGSRNGLTFWAACRAGEMVASGMLKADTAAAIIAEAATRCGLELRRSPENRLERHPRERRPAHG